MPLWWQIPLPAETEEQNLIPIIPIISFIETEQTEVNLHLQTSHIISFMDCRQNSFPLRNQLERIN